MTAATATPMTNLDRIDGLSLAELAEELDITKRHTAKRLYRVDLLGTRTFNCTGIGNAHYALKYMRATGRLSAEAELKIAAMKPYELLALLYSCKAGTQYDATNKLKEALYA